MAYTLLFFVTNTMRSKIHVSNEPLMCIAYNSDFEYLTIGGYSRIVYILSARNGKILSQLKGHTYEVLSVQFNPNHTQIASGGKESDLYLWDIPSSVATKRKGHLSHILDVKYYNEQVILSASLDSTVKIWDIRTSSSVQTLSDATDAVLSIIASGHEITTASADGCIRTYDIRYSKLNIDHLNSPTTDLQLFIDGKTILTTSQDGYIRQLMKENGKLLKIFKQNPYTNNIKCKLMQNDAFIVTPSSHDRRCITIYNSNNFSIYSEIPCHSNPISSLCCHPIENKFATIGQDGFLNLHVNVPR